VRSRRGTTRPSRKGWVIAESRAGFEWDGELLRAAEVIVAKRAGSKYAADQGEAE